MAYSIIVSPRAQREIENAIDYYALYSVDAPRNFVIQLRKAYNSLAINPFFGMKDNNIRSLKIEQRPYSLYFVINEHKMTVKILSCFHDKRNPKKRPRYNA